MNLIHNLKKIAVGMEVTCSKRFLDVEEGDIGTVLSINFVGFLSGFNVEVLKMSL